MIYPKPCSIYLSGTLLGGFRDFVSLLGIGLGLVLKRQSLLTLHRGQRFFYGKASLTASNKQTYETREAQNKKNQFLSRTASTNFTLYTCRTKVHYFHGPRRFFRSLLLEPKHCRKQPKSKVLQVQTCKQLNYLTTGADMPGAFSTLLLVPTARAGTDTALCRHVNG